MKIASLSASFMPCVEECISERESRRFEEGPKLNSIFINGLVRI